MSPRMKPVFRNPISNERGTSLMLALTMTAGLLISSFFIADYLLVQKKQVVRNAEAPQKRLVLHSALDYVIFGIKQRWCFSDTLLPDLNCGLSNNRSVERILMSPEQEIFLRDLKKKNIITEALPPQLRLNEIAISTRIDAMNSTHPLFKVLRGVANEDVEGLSLKITRDTSTTLPQTGKDTYLRIEVTLTDGSGRPITIGVFPMQAEVLVSVHPREVGSFALVIPKSIYLNRASAPSVGDVAFAPQSASGGLGLVFDSPVFVNRDIHLPDTTAANSYSPVTFGDRVYMGDGRVYQNGVPFEPKSAGGADNQLWTDDKQFGGFLKGLENDGARDAGLDFLADPTGSLTVDPSRMRACIARTIVRSDRSAIANSQLQAQTLAATSNSMSYRLGLSYANEFATQENAVKPVDKNGWRGNVKRDLHTSSDKPVALLEITVAGQTVSAQMTKDTTVEAALDMQYNQAYQAIEAQIQSRNNVINSKQGDVNGLVAQRNLVEKDLADAQARLAQAIKDNLSQSQIDHFKDQVKDAQKDLSKINNQLAPLLQEIANLNALNATANAQKQMLAQIINNPPAVRVSTDTILINGYAQPHVLNYKIEIVNSGYFRDLNGAVLQPVVKVKAYDATYFKSAPISTENTKLTGYFRPQVQANGQVQFQPGIFETENSNAAVNTTISIADNYGELDTICNTQQIATSGSAFGGASWDIDFAKNARHSWNFAGSGSGADNPAPAPLVPQLLFDAGNAREGVVSFQIRSIVGECIIDAGAEFVSGFLTCDRLVIRPRSRPLRIIGTIVASRVEIDSSAYRAGIRWSTIYHPQATIELRHAGILKSASSQPCDQARNPIWHPVPSIIEVADRYACNASSLRARANPFQWTAVDPDCGFVPGNVSQTCKNRLVRFYLVEHSRESKL